MIKIWNDAITDVCLDTCILQNIYVPLISMPDIVVFSLGRCTMRKIPKFRVDEDVRMFDEMSTNENVAIVCHH